MGLCACWALAAHAAAVLASAVLWNWPARVCQRSLAAPRAQPAAPTPRQEAWRELLDFWFAADDITQLVRSRWFTPDGSAAQARLDAEVTSRFGTLLARAERGELDGWASTPASCLALILLLDQVSRHVHRAVRSVVDANDVHALRHARALLSRGWECELRPAELVFALMPLGHSTT